MRAIREAALAAGFALFCHGAHAADPAPIRVALVIEQQPLRTALATLADQTGLQIMRREEDASADGLMAPRLVGEMSPKEALDKLLANSGLTYQFLNERTVRVSKVADETTTPGPPKGKEGKIEEGERPLALARSRPRETEAVATKETTNSRARENANNPNAREQVLQEVVVTGSHIRGTGNPAESVAVYDRAAIERSGYATTQDFIRSLPQNFKGGSNGASEDGILTGKGLNNIGNASGANLRGLGNSSTLVLIDGHRVAASMFGGIVDLGMFPIDAVDRIEVLTDGSSAIYGSDAIGGVLNILLRKDYQGAETNIRFDTLSQGGGETKFIGQTFGHAWQGGNALVALQYQDADAIHSDERSFTQALPRPVDVYPSSTKRSGVLSAEQAFSERLEGSIDAIVSHDTSFRNYTTGGSLPVSQALSNSTDFISTVVGTRWKLAQGWELDTSGLYSQVYSGERVNYTPSQPGYVNGSPYLRNLTTVKQLDVKLDGTLFRYSGGEIKAAIGGSYRGEAASSLTPHLGTERPSSRHVKSAFGELYLPLVGASNRSRFVHDLSISVAVRSDTYTDFGHSTNPKIGIFWAPIGQLGFRAAYSTSFRTPDPYEQIAKSQANTVFIFPGFSLPGGGTGKTLVFGSPTPLVPEDAKNWSAGLDLRPSVVPGLTVSLGYYKIEFDNRIIQAPFDIAALVKPEVYGPLIGQFGSDAEVASQVAVLQAQGYRLVDLSSGLGSTAGIRYSFPFGLINAAHIQTSGFDLGAHYSGQIGVNTISLGLNAANIRELATGFCDGCATTDLSNTYGQPLRYRVRADGGWSNGSWTINAAVNYANSYDDTNTVTTGRVGAFTSVDTNIRYSPDAWQGTTLSLNIINLLDEDPPSTQPTALGLRYDPQNADPRGRVVGFQVRHKW